ncbi:MAG: 3-keto-disaccharide hydrolase [Bacteroidota bacterium]
MKSALSIALAFLLFACGNSTKTETTTETEPAQAADVTPLPTLTEEQTAQGWRILFDGTTTNGWKIFKDRKNNSWEVVNGTLHCKAPSEVAGVDNERSDLMTVEQFENFELSLEWKLAAQSNSGIIFRVTEEYEQPYFTGPEYQLIDDQGYPEEKDVHLTGANYDVHAVPNKKMNKLGEWNHTKIVANGNKVEHWLNGEKILEYEIGSADWTQRKNASKWKDVVGYCVPKSGHIDLQDHGGEAWFRNIMIRPL